LRGSGERLSGNEGEGEFMKIGVAGLAALAGAVALCFSAPVFGQIQIHFTGNNYGIYDPYYATVTQAANPVTIGGADGNGGEIICDDYNDHIVGNETWNVTAIQASNLNTTNIQNTTFGPSLTTTLGSAQNAVNAYAEVAALVNVLINTNWTTAGTTVTLDSLTLTNANLSDAIWQITNPSLSLGDSTANSLVTALGLGSNTVDTNLADYSKLWILTPAPPTGYNPPGGDGEPQEMWVETTATLPEGGAALLYLLISGAACFGAMAFSPRKILILN
jgi:hypothetical protein